ncbi:hypothetical protein HYU14_02510 [Candidatus Woesearchaeota archaeon]|nr:hypothetical protein [Candidatus Woesearchaeota archaeon]
MLRTYPWDSKETRQIKKTINGIARFLVNEIRGDLITVYLAGTILTPERTPESDIDLFCIVGSEFDFSQEDKINAFFKEQKDSLCGGREVKFHGIPLSELEGGKPKSRITSGKSFSIPIRVLVKQFPHFKRVLGRKIDFTRFPTSGISPREEIGYWLRFAERNIASIRQGTFNRPFSDFIKTILRLCNADAQFHYGYTFDPSFKKLAKHLQKEERHIVHLCIDFRAKGKALSKKEKDYFLRKAGDYVFELRNRIKSR